MKTFKCIPILLAICLLLTGCSQPTAGQKPQQAPTVTDVTEIVLSDSGIIVDGIPITDDTAAEVFAANDIVYYEEGHDFTYGEGTEADAHSKAEADAHTVVHITKPGTYSLSGSLSAGQIAVDLGKDAKKDPNAVVTLILSGIDVTCTVAPAVIFYNVYECGSAEETDASMEVDTSAAGANVVIADGTKNTVNGAYVAKIYESVELNDEGTEVEDSKKLHKYDGAFYSKMSMNIFGGETGDGILRINAQNEGLDSELHLTVHGGNIQIRSGNDGINTNEDGISVTSIRGGTLDIAVTGQTGEGDGIDSNGWLVIDGGTVTASACATSGDAGIDADNGVYIRGGTVAASGNMLDPVQAGQTYVLFSFSQRQTGGSYTLSREETEIFTCAPVNDFQYLLLSSPELEPGDYTFCLNGIPLAGYAGNMQMGGQRPEGMEPPEDGKMPEDMQPPENGEMPEDMQPPENMERPDGMQPPAEGEAPPQQPGGMQRPGGQGNMGGNRADGETSAIFTVAEGANNFFIIGIVEAIPAN